MRVGVETVLYVFLFIHFSSLMEQNTSEIHVDKSGEELQDCILLLHYQHSRSASSAGNKCCYF